MNETEVKDGGLHCYDCERGAPPYMVVPEVWRVAFPNYVETRRVLFARHPKDGPTKIRRHLCLCFKCIEKRLGRKLVPEDFDLTLPINHGIALGMRMQQDRKP